VANVLPLKAAAGILSEEDVAEIAALLLLPKDW
jgi:hypothetical protein